MAFLNSASPQYVTAASVKKMLSGSGEIAFLDVREHGQYGEGHPFFSVNCPYSQIETVIAEIVPNPAARVILMDDGDGISERAARQLNQIGYETLFILKGGAPAWADAGYQLFKGVNVPSKAFGELVEHDMGTPSLSPEELKQRQESGAPLAIFDGRTPGEYSKMNIPGAVCIPNAELGLRIPSLIEDPSVPIVVNCAGRTRSIIGAQTLRELGFKNPVLALRNGTQGWQLAGFDLEYGTPWTPMPNLTATDRQQTKQRYEAFVKSHALPIVDATTLTDWCQDEGRTTYLLDPRSKAEFDAGHYPGVRHAPGGQLVQATDLWVGVRNARLILIDPLGIRAATTCFWLRRMGHDAYILDPQAAGLTSEIPVPHTADRQEDTAFATVSAHDAAARIADGAQVLDLSPSETYRTAHISQARWAIRPRLDRLDIDPARPVILTALDPSVARNCAKDLVQMGISAPLLLDYDPQSWRAGGLEITSTPSDPPDSERIDFLFFVHDRHDGSMESARRYLEWETGLIAQMDEDELSVFRCAATTAA
ncbi:hypothetical protein I5535_02735 [Rhodobacteraceae bacterium F11138]|nr:hypothetical protein [Rhodobacteraceae bacterium F11138]